MSVSIEMKQISGSNEEVTHCSMALRKIWMKVRMAEPKAQVPKEGPSASLTERLVVPTMDAPGGAKYHCAIAADRTNLRISPCKATHELIVQMDAAGCGEPSEREDGQAEGSFSAIVEPAMH